MSEVTHERCDVSGQEFMNVRRVAILGATGATGSAILRRVLGEGAIVSVLARNPARLPPTIRPIRVVVGDSTDLTAVREVIGEADVVFSTIGRRPAVFPSRSVTVCEQSSSNVVKALRDSERKRYIVVSSTGTYVPGDALLRPWERLVTETLRLAYRADFLDRDREATLISESDLRWTLIRPSFLLSTRSRRYVVHPDRIVGPWTSREAVADFAVRAARDSSFECTAPYIANWRPGLSGRDSRLDWQTFDGWDRTFST